MPPSALSHGGPALTLEDVCCWPWAPSLTETQGQTRPRAQAGGTVSGGEWARWPAVSSPLPQRPPESPFRAGPLEESGARDQALAPGPETTAPWRQHWGSAGGGGAGCQATQRGGAASHEGSWLEPLVRFRGCVLRVDTSPWSWLIYEHAQIKPALCLALDPEMCTEPHRAALWVPWRNGEERGWG